MNTPALHRHTLATMLSLALSAQVAATPVEVETEHIRLATLLRELNAIDRIAAAGDTITDLGTTRYHFNYTRLRADIQRVSTGIQRYLSPTRAAPRDSVAVHGDYQDEAVPAL